MKKRILIADDHTTNVAVLRELLEDDYELATAANGEECLERMRTFGPDVVLLDVMMPGLNGYEVCQRIKACPYGGLTQVVLVSAQASTEARLKGYAVGADDYIVKPFDHDEMLAKVRVQFKRRDTLLELARARAGLAVQNADLEDLVRQRTADIARTRDVTVFALVKLAESRDPETGHHLERIRAYSQVLTEELARTGPYRNQIDKQFLEDMYRSSPLHDIGKVGIPDAVLLKPGRLDPAEFDIMKRHTVIGAEALEMAAGSTGSGDFLAMGVDIARGHHERFDGQGYPCRQAGQDIPLAARIVALADVFDAITSARVYKPAYDPTVAREAIEKDNGRQFDPVVVGAFQARWEEFLTIRRQHTDQALPPVELAMTGS